MKQLLILSGKGGTGKTTIASAFIKILDAKAYADCDVDAPNLHLVLDHLDRPKETDYYGLPKAKINNDLCVECDACRQHCRFNAISFDKKYIIDNFACEGCGVCAEICKVNAIKMVPEVAGELTLYEGDRIFSTAKLKMGSGTSGMLVTRVKNQMKEAAKNAEVAIIDGSPGIGCPVIASLSGVDMVLIVAEPSVSGISDMERIIKTANNFQTKIAVCVNKYNANIEKTKKIEKYCEKMNLPFVGKIPFDTKAVEAINNGQSIVDIDCEAGKSTKGVFDKTFEIL